MAGREPAGHKPGDTGEEPGFSNAKQEAHYNEAGGAGDERGAGRANAPDHHGDTEPSAGADPGQHDVGGELEQHIAPEKGTRGQPIGGGGQAERLVHCQRRNRDIETIERVDQVAEAEERDQPPGDLTHDSVFDVGMHCCASQVRFCGRLVRRLVHLLGIGENLVGRATPTRVAFATVTPIMRSRRISRGLTSLAMRRISRHEGEDIVPPHKASPVQVPAEHQRERRFSRLGRMVSGGAQRD